MRRRLGWWVPGVLLAVVLFLLVVRLHPGGPRVGRAVDDVGQLLALATGAWAGGEAAWSYFELFAGRQTPFPSVADAGYLLFAVLAVAGMLLWPSDALRGGARWRGLLDGVLVAGSLFTITWVSALGSVAHAGGDSRFAFAVSLAYPVTDLVLLTLTVVVVAHARQASGSGLGLLAAGLGLLCLADSGFAFLTAAGSYATGSPVDAGWFGGFLLVAAAACTASTPGAEQVDQDRALESTTAALLPYLPAGLAVAVAVGGQLTGHSDAVALLAATLVMAALLARQLLAVLDNRRLVVALVDTQQELRFQAFHDPLTGLANRALFADRLRHGLELHRRDLRPLSLLYCDLDGFKTVNDTLGHDAGDDVIKAAAERLRAVTRPGDTVARMGGDEFAILLEDGGDATTVVAKILDAFTQPAATGRDLVPLAASIGVAELSAGAGSPHPAEFLQRADAAMYQAKRTGKGRAVVWNEQLQPAKPTPSPAATVSAAPGQRQPTSGAQRA